MKKMGMSQPVRSSRWPWYAVPAFLVYALGYFAGALTGDALLYVGGAVVALVILAPVWAKQPRYLLIGLVIYLPIEDAILQAFTAHVTIERVVPDALLLLAFCLRLPLARLRRERVFGTPLDLPIALILLVAGGSFVYNHIAVSVAAGGVYVLLRYVLVFYLAASSRFTERDVRVFVLMIVAVAILQCVVGAVEFVLLHFAGLYLFNFDLVQGTTGYFNVLGMYLAIACIMALACYSPTWITHPTTRLALLVGASSAVIILALSRQSLASLAIGWIVIAIFGRRYWPLRMSQLGTVAVAGAAVVAASALLTVVSPAVLSGTTSTARQSPVSTNSSGTEGPHSTVTVTPKPTSASKAYDTAAKGKGKQFNPGNLLSPDFYKNSRLYEIVNGGEAVLQQSPLVGLGPGTFGGQATFHDQAFYDRLNVGLLLSDPKHTYVSDVEWMTIFGQLGLLGLLGFVAIFVQIWRLAYRAFKTSGQEMTRRLALATMALVLVWIVVGFTGPNFELRPVSIWIWILPGMLWSLLRQERQVAKDERVVAAMRGPTTFPG